MSEIELQPNDKGQVGAVHKGTTAPANTDLLWVVLNGAGTKTDHRYYETGSGQWKSLLSVVPTITSQASLQEYTDPGKLVHYTRAYNGTKYHFLMQYIDEGALDNANGYDLVNSTELTGHWRAIAKTNMMFAADMGAGSAIIQHPFVPGHTVSDFMIENENQNYAAFIQTINGDRIELTQNLFGPVKVYVL